MLRESCCRPPSTAPLPEFSFIFLCTKLETHQALHSVYNLRMTCRFQPTPHTRPGLHVLPKCFLSLKHGSTFFLKPHNRKFCRYLCRYEHCLNIADIYTVLFTLSLVFSMNRNIPISCKFNSRTIYIDIYMHCSTYCIYLAVSLKYEFANYIFYLYNT